MRFLGKRVLLWLLMCGLGILAAGATSGWPRTRRRKTFRPRCPAAELPAAAPAVVDPKMFPPYFTKQAPMRRSRSGRIRPALLRLLGDSLAGPGGRRRSQDQVGSDLYDRIAHNLFSINFVWTLMAGFLVMFMQAGFALVETGLGRAKNASHTMAMNFMIYPLGCFGFWAYGFALGWGNWFNGPVPDGWYAALGPGLAY